MKGMKKISAILLVFMMIVGFMPGQVQAAGEDSSCAHEIGDPFPPNYSVCNGGYKDWWYQCTECGKVFKDKDGTELLEIETGRHTPGTEIFPKDFEICTGGYKEDYYRCTECAEVVDKDGKPYDRSDADPEAKHTPDGWERPPYYTPCDGGYTESYYQCKYCQCVIDENGDLLDRKPPTGLHKPGAKHYANYTECGGGFDVDFYYCVDCEHAVDANGKGIGELEKEGNGNHTPRTEIIKANHTNCGGGFADHYECVDCGRKVDKSGVEVEWVPGDGTGHTMSTELIKADYITCYGGYREDHYECTVCGVGLDQAGNEIYESMGNGKHRLTHVPAKAATYEADGNKEYWTCDVCKVPFADKEGIIEIEDETEYILPKLEKPAPDTPTMENPETTPAEEYEVKESVLTEVPKALREKYKTIEDVKDALVKAALEENTNLDSTKVVFLDVTLVHKDGKEVTADNFPKEGVEVVLDYPKGTSKDNYNFVITHMISSGPKAGEVEILKADLKEDGIHVTFTSMSPVSIMYQKKPAATTTAPQTGDGTMVGLMVFTMVSGAAVFFACNRKRKFQ